jgi:hypothetical protein
MRWFAVLALVACSTDENLDDDLTTDTDVTDEDAGPGPVAVDDVASATAGESIDIDVLDNDSHPDDERLKVDDFTSPSNGSVEFGNGLKSVVYTPDIDFEGTDTFEYTVVDVDDQTDAATVTVSVEAFTPPTLIITWPEDGEKVNEADVQIEFDVTNCMGSSPSADSGDCHFHRWVDDETYSPFGFYQGSPMDDIVLTPGEHTVTIQVIKNDGSDQPFEPIIEDSVTFTVK